MKCILYNQRTVQKGDKKVIESIGVPKSMKIEITEVSPPDIILYNGQTYVLSYIDDDGCWMYYIATICDLNEKTNDY